MYVTITQTINGNKEILVKNYPVENNGDLVKALEEAHIISVINDGVAFPEGVTERTIKLSDKSED